MDLKNDILVIKRRMYEIERKLKFDDSVIEAGNPPTLHPDDRRALIDELDSLCVLKRSLLKGPPKDWPRP